jgi:hypothetical protein
MHLCHHPDDPRVEQRNRVRQELDQLLDVLARDTSPRLVLHELVAAAGKLNRRIEDVDRTSLRGRGARQLNPLVSDARGGPTS